MRTTCRRALRAALFVHCVVWASVAVAHESATDESVESLPPEVPEEDPAVGAEPPALSADADPQSPLGSEALTEAESEALEAALEADQHETTLPTVTAPVVAETAVASALSYDLSLILAVAGAWFSEEPRLLGAHDPGEGFSFQQLELTLGASVDPYFRLDSSIAFSLFGVEVEEAYVTTLALPGNLQLRAGQFLTRIGRLNPTHPHVWSFIDQPLVNGKLLGPEGHRGVGVEANWLSPLPWFAELVASVNHIGDDGHEGHEEPTAELPIEHEEEHHHDEEVFESFHYTARLEQFFPLGDALSLLWGMGVQFGPHAFSTSERTEIYESDLYLRYRPVTGAAQWALSLQLEGMFRRRALEGDVIEDHGGRAELVWDISPRWQTGVRYEMVSGAEGDPEDLDWISPRHRGAYQFSFLPSHFSRLRLQFHYDDATWFEGPEYGVMLGLNALIGAHGAHKY